MQKTDIFLLGWCVLKVIIDLWVIIQLYWRFQK